MIEVVYAPINSAVFRVKLDIQEPITVAQALKLSAILEHYPEVVDYPTGVFSKLVTHEELLAPGDRLEIYRSLTLDPKTQRRQRAKSKA